MLISHGQANFIFDIRKDQTSFRNRGRRKILQTATHHFTTIAEMLLTADIVEAYMTKINFLWQTYQNCIINDVDATILSDELMGSMLAASR